MNLELRMRQNRQINKEIKKTKKENSTSGFTYDEKDKILCIKVKKQHTKKFSKFKFEQDNSINETQFNLGYYDYNEKRHFYWATNETTEQK